MDVDSSNTKYVSVDEMLTHVGEFGPFQWSLMALFFTMNAIPANQTLIMSFGAMEPPWKCIHNSSICLINGTLPSDDNRRCSMGRNEWTYVESSHFSIATQFDLYCDREWIIELVLSTFYIGYAFGSVILGWIADNYGRRTVIIPSHFLAGFIGFVSSFSTNITEIIISRLILGFLYPGIYVQTMILISELVGIKQKVLACQLLTLGFPIFWLIMALEAYYIREWKFLFILSTVPYMFPMVFYRYIPESIRWLRLKGELEKISTMLTVIARRNNKVIPENIEILPIPDEVLQSKTSPIEIFRTKKLAIESAVQGYCWFAVGVVYLGIYFAANNLGGSLYRDFAILTVADIPGYFLTIYFCERIGRKKTFVFSSLMAGVTYLSIAFVPRNVGLKCINIILGTTAKLSILVSCMTLYQWSVEIYPTEIRGIGFGFVELCGRIGSSVAPWIATGLNSVSKSVPVVVMGVLAITAAFLALRLPETRGHATAECIVETSDIENSTNTKNGVIVAERLHVCATVSQEEGMVVL